MLVASSCTDVVDAKKKKKKKAKGRTSGAVLLDDESFDGAIKDKGAFVKFLAPW